MDNPIESPRNFQRQTILALNHLGQVVTSSLKLEDVLARIMEQVTLLLDAEGVGIIMPEGDDLLKFVAVCGMGAAQLKGTTMPRDSGVVGFVMQTGTAVWLNDAGGNVPGLAIYRQIELISEFHSESLLAAPLVQGGRTIGVLEAAHSRADGLTADDLPALVQAFAGGPGVDETTVHTLQSAVQAVMRGEAPQWAPTAAEAPHEPVAEELLPEAVAPEEWLPEAEAVPELAEELVAEPEPLAGQPQGQAPDPEIAAIFTEEAAEVLERIATQLPPWRAAPLRGR